MGVFFYVSGLCFMISEFLEIKWIFIPARRLSFVNGPSELVLPRTGSSVPKTLRLSPKRSKLGSAFPSEPCFQIQSQKLSPRIN